MFQNLFLPNFNVTNNFNYIMLEVNIIQERYLVRNVWIPISTLHCQKMFLAELRGLRLKDLYRSTEKNFVPVTVTII